MIAVQGPKALALLSKMAGCDVGGYGRFTCNPITLAGRDCYLCRTGYTGDPLGFELFMDKEQSVAIWDLLISLGAEPIGLAARDTLRLEAGMPLYGHEFGIDPEGKEIPGKFPSLDPIKPAMVGSHVRWREKKEYIRTFSTV